MVEGQAQQGHRGGWIKRAVLVTSAALFATGTVLSGLFTGGFGALPDKGAHLSAPPPGVAATSNGSDLSDVVLDRFQPPMAWVTVPVATVWAHPRTSRPEDSDAVSGRPDVAKWLRTLTYQQKLGLDDLLDTQLLMDEEVMIVGRAGAWTEVAIPEQKGSIYPYGISGWVSSAQISTTAPPASPVTVTVAVPVVHAGGLALSYGTRLPARPKPDGSFTLVLPGGQVDVAGSEVRVNHLTPSGGAVVAEARRFMGLQYLWAGTSAFGYDCSGLTYSVYRQFGVDLPRDAADQARSGHPVAEANLKPGDLVFFAFEPTIDHVGIYVGNGMMIDAPETGRAIEEIPLSSLQRWYAGGSRYI